MTVEATERDDGFPQEPCIGEPLPAAGDAHIDTEKLIRYALDPDHPVGKHKAEAFRLALGIERDDWEYPRDSILEQLRQHPVTSINCDPDSPDGGENFPSSRVAEINSDLSPRLFLEYAKASVERTFTYELVDLRPDPERDEREKNFGLFENDWSYKPSATALKNLIGFLDSPSTSSRTRWTTP